MVGPVSEGPVFSHKTDSNVNALFKCYNDGMKRGVKPTPTTLLPPDSRSHYDRAKEPMPVGDLASPPEYLCDAAKQAWFSLATKLKGMGVGKDVDEDAFARYCETYAMWVDVAEKVRVNGPSEQVTTQYGTKTQRTGDFTAYMDLLKQLERMECKFGLTPADRVGLGKTQGKNDGQHGNSKRAALLNRKKA